jgi:hypothetical protein
MRLIVLITLLFCLSCKTNQKALKKSSETQSDFTPVFTAGPPVLVYKTKGNYNNLVPVLLSDDKSEIVSYPHPKDLKTGSGYPLPVILKDGFLLDNRGIGKNVAFLKISYEEYAKLENAPSLKELFDKIIDKDPLTELCNCGIKTAFTDEVNQLNYLIDNKKLRSTCKIIK